MYLRPTVSTSKKSSTRKVLFLREVETKPSIQDVGVILNICNLSSDRWEQKRILDNDKSNLFFPRVFTLEFMELNKTCWALFEKLAKFPKEIILKQKKSHYIFSTWSCTRDGETFFSTFFCSCEIGTRYFEMKPFFAPHRFNGKSKSNIKKSSFLLTIIATRQLLLLLESELF